MKHHNVPYACLWLALMLGLQPSIRASQGAQTDGGPATASTANTVTDPTAVTITGMDKVHYDALQLIADEADKAKSPDERTRLLSEYLDRSTTFLQTQPGVVSVWLYRAGAAMELGRAKQGWEAGQQLLKLRSDNPLVAEVDRILAKLDIKGWLGAEPIPVVGTAWILSSLKLEMKFIRPGTFMMGSPAGEPDRHPAETQHQVTLTQGYWLGATDVTQAQWQAIMGTTIQQQLDKVKTKAKFDRHQAMPAENATLAEQALAAYVLSGEGPNNPMYFVSWDEAVMFCQLLTERERDGEQLPPGYAYTLPTEAQWEFACRAGKTGAYAGDLDSLAWYAFNSGTATHPVGTKLANDWGLSDMHGNVLEWCADWEGPYPGGAVTDPVGPATGSDRIDRGGGWDSSATDCRSAYRNSDAAGTHNNHTGFRLALSPVGKRS